MDFSKRNKSLYIDTEALFTFRGRFLSKAQKTSLSLGQLQQLAHATSRIIDFTEGE